MRIIFQGSMTPKQLAKAVQTIIEDTLKKAEVKGKRQVLHNPVIETNLNIQGFEDAQLLIDSEKDAMLQFKTGILNGEFVEYEEVDRTELIDKFNRVTDGLLDKMDEAHIESEKKELETIN